MMLTNQQLVDKARDAIVNYERIYGKYPPVVGIDRQRLRSMTTTQIAFPVLNGPLPPFYCEDDIGHPQVTGHMEIVRFDPYVGGNPNEVYLPHPRDNRKAVSGAALARLWRMVESKRLRTLYEPLGRDFTKEYYGAFLG